MENVFISYSHHDNKNYHENHINEYVDYLKWVYQVTFGYELNVFIDKDIRAGDEIHEEIKEQLEKSLVMISFLSPSYFNSNYCRQEFEHFTRFHKNYKIIPLIKEDVTQLSFLLPKKEDYHEKMKEYHEKMEEYYNKQKFYSSYYSENHDLASPVKTKLCITLPDISDKKKLHPIFVGVARDIHAFFLKNRKQPITNIHIEDTPIDERKDFNELKSKIKKIKDDSNTPFPVCVCVIYTGGSVGMIKNKSESYNANTEFSITKNAKNIVDRLPQLKDLDFDMHFFSYKNPIDSSNIKVNDWIKIASIIKELYNSYDGFVILHGANTLAYTASALSFIFNNLTKPVILTGSELPLDEIGSDAEQNILRAVSIASLNSKNSHKLITEVCILYGDSLLRGNRSTKKHTLNKTEGFYSPNYGKLGEYHCVYGRERLRIDKHLIRPSKLDSNPDSISNLEIDNSLDLISNLKFDQDSVHILTIYPGMNIEWIKKQLETSNIKGLILRSYTTGNVPSDTEFMDMINSCIKKGIIIVNITQCPIGQVELRLSESNVQLFNLDVINGGDMTMEAAYCKLKYLLGVYEDHINDADTIKEMFQTDMRGELSLNAHSIDFGSSELHKANYSPVYRSVCVKKMPKGLDWDKVEHVFLRLQNVTMETLGECEFNIYANYNELGIDSILPIDPKFELMTFKKDITNKAKFNKTIEITHQIRKIYHSDLKQKQNKLKQKPISIQIFTSNKMKFKFDEVTIIIYTINY